MEVLNDTELAAKAKEWVAENVGTKVHRMTDAGEVEMHEQAFIAGYRRATPTGSAPEPMYQFPTIVDVKEWVGENVYGMEEDAKEKLIWQFYEYIRVNAVAAPDGAKGSAE